MKVSHHWATLSLLSGENQVENVATQVCVAINVLGHVQGSHGFQELKRRTGNLRLRMDVEIAEDNQSRGSQQSCRDEFFWND